jgi:EmrB/QacA subfamily drug resistance transporter
MKGSDTPERPIREATPMATPAPAAPIVGAGLTARQRTLALCVILLAFFMDVLDNTIVNVAIPSIQMSLGASYSSIQWIIAGYALTFALFLIAGGRLGDIYGYKWLFLGGMAGFVVASALCGFAVSTEMLIASRLLQGFMAAMMVPQILSTIQVMFTTTAERQGVSAFYGALAGLATVGGPIIGALLISGDVAGLGWRAIFLVNVPVGVGAIILGWLFVPDAKSPHPLRIDTLGIALIVLAMLMLMYPLVQGRELGWPWWTFASMAASLVVFAAFAWYQVARDRSGAPTLVVPRLFGARSFVAGIGLLGAFFAIVSGFFLILTLFLQVGLGYSVLTAGLTTIPFSLGVSVAAGLSGPILVPRFGRNIVSAGPAVMAIGFLVFIGTIALFGTDVAPWQLSLALLVAGIGMGFVVAPVYPFILAEVPIKDAGSASGVTAAVSQIGGAIGIAAIGAIYFGLIGSEAAPSVQSVRAAMTADLTAAGLPAVAVTSVVTPFETCFRDRANAKDFSVAPESCRKAEADAAAFARTQPALAEAIGVVIAKHSKQAVARNFASAITWTLAWQIGALVLVFFLSFLLPRRPRSEAEMAAAGVAAI